MFRTQTVTIRALLAHWSLLGSFATELDSHHCNFYSTFVSTLESDYRITLVDLVECSACFMLIYFFNSFIDPEVLHPHLMGHDLLKIQRQKTTSRKESLIISTVSIKKYIMNKVKHIFVKYGLLLCYSDHYVFKAAFDLSESLFISPSFWHHSFS